MNFNHYIVKRRVARVVLFFFLITNLNIVPFYTLSLTGFVVHSQTAEAADVDLRSGINFFSYPTDIPVSFTCDELLTQLGADGLKRLNANSQLFEDCLNNNFDILPGDGYVVNMAQGSVVNIIGDSDCPVIDLPDGLNLIGIPTPFPGMGCYQLLQTLGDNSQVSAVQRFNTATGSYQSCYYDSQEQVSTPTGLDFAIQAGEAYIISNKQALSSVALNDESQCVSNQLPVLNPINNQLVSLGQSLNFTVTASDFEGANLDLMVSPLPLPRNAIFDPNTGLFTFTPDANQVGSVDLTFSVSDGIDSVFETITLTVEPGDGITAVSGVVMTSVANNLEPLADVRLEIGGVETTSAADGSFILSNIPAGKQRFLIDGSTVDAAKGTFATVPEHIEIIPGTVNVLPSPIFLLPLDVASADPIDPGVDSVIDSSPIMVQGLEFLPVVLNVPAGTARDEGSGQLFNGDVYISQIPSNELGPMPMPDDIELSVYIAIQPFGVKYDPPAAVAFPNVEGFPVDAIVDIMGLNHDTGVFEKVGDGQVLSDGMIHSGHFNPDGNVFTEAGIVKNNSWHGFVPQEPTDRRDRGNNGNCKVGGCNGSAGSEADMRTGDLTVSHDLVSYRSFESERSLRLEYHSSTAFPRPNVSALISNGNLTPPPLFMATEVQVAGISQARIVTEGPAFCRFNCPFARQVQSVDVSDFMTGIYPASITVDCQFQNSRRSREINQSLMVVNQRQSPFGVGWGLTGLQQIHTTASGELLLTQGDDVGLVFIPAAHASAEIRNSGERDFYRFIANRGDTITLRMRRRSNQPDGSSSLDPQLELLNSQGFTLIRNTDDGLGLVDGPGSNALIASFVVPATDTYTVIASGEAGSRGTYDFYLTSAKETFLSESKINTPLPIAPAFNFNGEIQQEGIAQSHAFVAEAGTQVTIAVNRIANQVDGSSTLDPMVELFDSNGSLIASDNDTGSNLPIGPGKNALIINLSLPADDVYTISVSGNNATLGSYTADISFDSLNGIISAGDSGTTTIDKTILSPLGEFSSLAINPDDTYSRRMKDGTIIEFDPNGRQASITDRNGNSTVHSYDIAGRLTSIQDPLGKTTLLRYVNGLIDEIEDPAGRITGFNHNPQGDLVQITDPDNSRRQFSYDQNHLLTGQLNKRDFSTVYEYDFSGRYQSSTLPDGSTRGMIANQSVGLVDLAMGGGSEETPAPAILSVDLQSSYADGNGNAFKVESIDDLGNPTSILDALGRRTLTERDAHSQPLKVTRPNGAVQEMTYDDRGNLTSTTDLSINATTRYEYETTFNKLTKITDANGNSTEIRYDNLGNPIEIINAVGTRNLIAYEDPVCPGLLTRITVASGLPEETILQTVYDPQSCNISSQIDPLGNVNSFTYDLAGNINQLTDAKNKVTQLVFDSLNRITQVIDANQEVTRNAYDQAGNLISLTDANTHITRFVYDARDRVIQRIDPLDNIDAFAYDGNGNLQSVTDRKGQAISYEYDAENQLLRKILPDNQITAYSYDSVGNITDINDPDSDINNTYDGASRITSTSTNNAPNQPGVNISYGYDKTGNQLSMTENISGITNYVYDSLNRITSIINPAADQIDFEYDVLNRLILTTASNGTSSARQYDTASRLTGLTYLLDQNTLAALNYTYDALGNRETITQQRSVLNVVSPLNFVYGNLSQLTAATRPVSGALQSFSYDPLGNRLLQDAQITASRFDAVNRLLEDEENTYRYDLNGNLIEKIAKNGGATTVYSYDAENQLIQVDLPQGDSVNYRYDGLGRRIEKNVAGVLTRYIYDNEDILFEYDGINQLTARYTHGLGIDEPLVMQRDLDDDGAFSSEEGFFYNLDGLGSVIQLTDTNGSVVQAYVYDAFGNISGETGTLQNPYTFTSREFDAETGLYYYRARYYDAVTGRFITEDPIGFNAGDINFYRYVLNNPLNLIDPDGNVSAIPILIIIVGILIGQSTGSGLPDPGTQTTSTQGDKNKIPGGRKQPNEGSRKPPTSTNSEPLDPKPKPKPKPRPRPRPRFPKLPGGPIIISINPCILLPGLCGPPQPPGC